MANADATGPADGIRLEQGLTALVRAGEQRDWFAGHFGAALISGAFLLAPGRLPAAAADALRERLAVGVEALQEWVAPLEGADEPADPLRLVDALDGRIASLQRSGHGTIYLAAALRALAERPALATRRNVEGLIALHEASTAEEAGRYFGVADPEAVPLEAIDRAGDVVAATRAAFAECDHLVPDREVAGVRYFFFGEKIHGLTHLHALLVLERLGHLGLARKGLPAHRRQLALNRQDAIFSLPLPDPARSTPADAGFWRQDGFDGFHQLKLADAALELVARLAPHERPLQDRRLAQMWSLLGIA